MVGLGSLFSLMKQMSGDMGEFRADMVKVKEDITGLRDYVVPGLEIMKGDVGKLHKQMSALEGEVREVKQDVSHWKTQISGIEDKVDQQGKRMSTFFSDVKKELSEGSSSLTGVKATVVDEQHKKVSAEAEIEESYRRLEELNQQKYDFQRAYLDRCDRQRQEMMELQRQNRELLLEHQGFHNKSKMQWGI